MKCIKQQASGHIYPKQATLRKEVCTMKDKDMKKLISRAGEEGSRNSQKIKSLEYKMDFGSVAATVSMSLN